MNPMDNLIRKMNLSTLSIPSVHITDIIDIIIVAIVIYTVIHWNRKNIFSRRNCRNYNLSAGT